jgi:hypothetical protein
VTVVQFVVLAFGLTMLGFAAFWLRFAVERSRSSEFLGANVRYLIVTRIGAYLVIGVAAVVVALTRSEWVGWIGIVGLLSKVPVEGYFRRRERRGVST